MRLWITYKLHRINICWVTPLCTNLQNYIKFQNKTRIWYNSFQPQQLERSLKKLTVRLKRRINHGFVEVRNGRPVQRVQDDVPKITTGVVIDGYCADERSYETAGENIGVDGRKYQEDDAHHQQYTDEHEPIVDVVVEDVHVGCKQSKSSRSDTASYPP